MSAELAQEFTDFCVCNSSGPNTLEKLIDLFMEDLMKEYQGNCKNVRWWSPQRQNKLIGRMEDRLGDRWDRSVEEPCPLPVNDDPIKPEGYDEHHTSWGTVWTKVYDDHYTWPEGKALCAADGDFLHMPIPESMEQNDFYFNLVGFKFDRDLWLDINDEETQGVYMNAHGEEQTFFNWDTDNNEPNNIGLFSETLSGEQQWGEHHLEMLLSAWPAENARNGKWNDMHNHESTQNRIAYGKNNLVVCTYVVPPVHAKPDGYDEHQTEWGTVYTKLYSDEVHTFEQGQAICANDAVGQTVPHMPTPQDWNQNQFYYDLASAAGVANNADLWLDISRYGPDGLATDDFCYTDNLCTNDRFFNTDGTRQTFFKWLSSEPNGIPAGENYAEMVLSGNVNQNGKWNDKANVDNSGPTTRFSKSKDNLVMCTFTVPNTESPVTDCGYGWESLDLTDGAKCVQINRYKTKIDDALAHCRAQGSTLALPTNEDDNFAFSEAFGYHVNEINTFTGDEYHEHMNLWLGAYRDPQGKL